VLRYWPTHEEIERCIKSQAESADVSVLLAVHQETPLSVRNVSGSGEVATTETEFLDAFLTTSLPEGILLMPVTGPSGVGKSHVIRWLDAQLRRDRRAANMLIIRIPKSASLRRVVELIVDPLKDDPRFTAVRQEIRQAVASVVPEEGGIRFAAELEIALNRFAASLRDQLRENPNGPDRQQQRERLDHAQKLPALFSDPVLEGHFKKNILSRIVQRAIVGQPDNVTEDEDVLPQFSPEDLAIPPDAAIRLSDASRAVQVYYATVLNKENGKGREVAADVLNEVADEAVGAVFRLNQSMAGMTLEEIIQEIRKSLLSDGRELVLLIEDFAALIGIHEVLLRVCIQEAIRDGATVMAPMRTALAVTEGHLAGRDTILTRARREWLVRSVFDEGDVEQRSIELVGAYLNAARWGEAELRKRFSERTLGVDGSLTGWISAFEDGDLEPAEADQLDAFDRSDAGYRLFPFNRSAIRSLAHRHLLVGGRLHFNPRRIIHFILQDILALRGEFEGGQFPPPNFQGARPNADLAAGLSAMDTTELVRGRLGSALYHWGGNPASSAQLAEIPKGIFEAFRLPKPGPLGLPSGRVAPARRVTATADKPKEPVVRETEDSFVTTWRNRLENWAAGDIALGQQDARYLRGIIARAVADRIDWNARCMKARHVAPDNFEIPFAHHGQALRPKVSLGEDSRDPTGRLRRFFLAAIRYEQHGRNWDYPDAEDDFSLFANMIEDLANRLAEDFRRLADEGIAPLVDLLTRQSRLLGIASRRVQNVGDLARIAMAPAPDLGAMPAVPIEGSVGQWEELRREAVARRKDLQDELAARICCFQGDGATRYGIDPSRLFAPLRAIHDGPVQVPDGLLEGQVRAHAVALSPVRLGARLNQLRVPLAKFSEQTNELFSDDADKAEVIADFKLLLAEIEGAGAWPDGDFDRRRLQREIEELRNLPAVELLRQVEPLTSKQDPPPTLDPALDILGKVDFLKIDRIGAILKGLEQFIGAAERKIRTENLSNSVASAQPAITDILNTMAGLVEALTTLGAEEATA
jgi:hypothetical protein